MNNRHTVEKRTFWVSKGKVATAYRRGGQIYEMLT